MEQVFPDLAWYIGVSDEKNVTPRCPFASVHRCPRYFQTTSVLSAQGTTAIIDPEVDKKVGEKWESSDLWPASGEERTGIMSSDGRPFSYYNFCPEVSGEIFGLFASSLNRYSDETDLATAHERLKNEDAPTEKDWRWRWAGVTERHYTQCSMFSLLSVSFNPIDFQRDDHVLTARPGLFGFSIDLRKLITRAARWWLSKNG